jgi:hypothetical protein
MCATISPFNDNQSGTYLKLCSQSVQVLGLDVEYESFDLAVAFTSRLEMPALRRCELDISCLWIPSENHKKEAHCALRQFSFMRNPKTMIERVDVAFVMHASVERSYERQYLNAMVDAIRFPPWTGPHTAVHGWTECKHGEILTRKNLADYA